MRSVRIVTVALLAASSACSQQPALRAALKKSNAETVGTMEICATGQAYAQLDGEIQRPSVANGAQEPFGLFPLAVNAQRSTVNRAKRFAQVPGQGPTGRATFDVGSFTATTDYHESTGRVQMTRRQSYAPGTLNEFPREERTDRFVADGYAWDLSLPADKASGTVPASVPQQAALKMRLAEIWMLPQGFLKAAVKHKASVKPAEGGTAEVDFTADDIRYNGTLDKNDELTRVRAWIPDGERGEIALEMTYADYRDYYGVRFPRHIARSRNGEKELELTVCSLKTNQSIEIFVPRAVQRTAHAQASGGA